MARFAQDRAAAAVADVLQRPWRDDRTAQAFLEIAGPAAGTARAAAVLRRQRELGAWRATPRLQPVPVARPRRRRRHWAHPVDGRRLRARPRRRRPAGAGQPVAADRPGHRHRARTRSGDTCGSAPVGIAVATAAICAAVWISTCRPPLSSWSAWPRHSTASATSTSACCNTTTTSRRRPRQARRRRAHRRADRGPAGRDGSIASAAAGLRDGFADRMAGCCAPLASRVLGRRRQDRPQPAARPLQPARLRRPGVDGAAARPRLRDHLADHQRAPLRPADRLGAAALGAFAAAGYLVLTGNVLLFAVAQTLLPRLVELRAAGARERFAALVRQVLAGVAVAGVLAVWPPNCSVATVLRDRLRRQYAEDAGTLTVLTIATAVAATCFCSTPPCRRCAASPASSPSTPPSSPPPSSPPWCWCPATASPARPGRPPSPRPSMPA